MLNIDLETEDYAPQLYRFLEHFHINKEDLSHVNKLSRKQILLKEKDGGQTKNLSGINYQEYLRKYFVVSTLQSVGDDDTGDEANNITGCGECCDNRDSDKVQLTLPVQKKLYKDYVVMGK